MKKLSIIFCLVSASLAYADVGALNAYLTEQATIFQPGGSTSSGDTYMHTWGMLRTSTGGTSSTYVDFVSQNDGHGWSSSCPSGQDINFHYFSISGTTLSSPTLLNCMTDFGGESKIGNWTTDTGFTWKSAGVLAVDGILYWAVERQKNVGDRDAYAPTIMMSTNGGRSWCYASSSDCASSSNNGKPPANETGEFCSNPGSCSYTSSPSDCGGGTFYDNCSPKIAYIHFVQYEKDGDSDMTVDGQDNYIYAMAADALRSNFYLMRISRTNLQTNIQTASNWQYYTGVVGGSITTSGNWTTWNSGTASGCSGSSDPVCGATVVLSTSYGVGNSNGGPIYVSSDFGYLICMGYVTRACYTSTSLTGESGHSSTGNWTPQIFAPVDVIPSGWSARSEPFLDDFPEPILATMSLANEGLSNATATLSISSSGDYQNGLTKYAMYTATLTLYKQNQTQALKSGCSPATNLPSDASPSLKYETYTADAEWDSSGPATKPYNIAAGTSTPLPTNLTWVEYGLGFPNIASTDVFKTPYNDTTGDFTLFAVYNRSDDVNTGSAYESIVDKTSDGYGGDDGFTIQRNDTSASEWCFFIGYGTHPSDTNIGGCDTTTTDLPDGRDSSGKPYFNLIAMEKKSVSGTSTLTVWNSKTATNSLTSPINSWSGTLSTPTANTYLRVGNSEGGYGNSPFTGTIVAFVYYNTALSSADAETATTAVEDQMYCSSRNINLPDVTGNN